MDHLSRFLHFLKAAALRHVQTQATEMASSTHPGSPDAVMVFGPNIPHAVVQEAEEECRRHGLWAPAFMTAGAATVDDLTLQLHAGGLLGPQTQLFVVCHGSTDANGMHRLALLAQGRDEGLVPTVELIRCVRRPGRLQPTDEAARTWPGTIHLISCGGGSLEQEIRPGTPDWEEGNCLVYASQANLLVHEGMQAMSHMFAFLARHRCAGTPPDPRQMLGHAAHRAADGIVLLGTAVNSPAAVSAPMLTPEVLPDFHAGEWLRARAHQDLDRNQSRVGLRAGKEDAAAVLATMAALDSASTAAEVNLRKRRLEDVLLSAIGRRDAGTVSLLLAARPELAEARTSTGAGVHSVIPPDAGDHIIQAVLQARLATLGPQVLLFRACADCDHRTVLRLLAMAPADALSDQDLALAMRLASERPLHGEVFFHALLDASALPEHGLVRLCLRLALEHGQLPPIQARRWRAMQAASPEQRADDERMLLAQRTMPAQAGAALADACRRGDDMLLDILLQRFGLMLDGQADRTALASLALSSHNSARLVPRLLERALVQDDAAMFRALQAQPGGALFLAGQAHALLGRACLGGCVQVAGYLLRELKADATPDARGDTPLHLAAASGRLPLVALLLSMPHVPDQTNHQGETALHVACRAGQDDVARHLAAQGAALHLRDSGGATPISLAQVNCSEETVSYLLARSEGRA